MTCLPEMSDGADSELRGWDLGWSDEFDGPLGAPADPSVWHHEVGGGGWGNDELQYYTGSTENASLDGDSNLAIVVRRTGAHAGESFNSGYTSARLVTKDAMAFSYGLVTARMKLPGGRGCGEIDIMEPSGDGSALVHATVHGRGYSGGVPASCRPQSSLSDEFHIY